MMRRTIQRQKLHAIGAKASEMIAQGLPLELVMGQFDVSRATFYRALKTVAIMPTTTRAQAQALLDDDNELTQDTDKQRETWLEAQALIVSALLD